MKKLFFLFLLLTTGYLLLATFMAPRAWAIPIQPPEARYGGTWYAQPTDVWQQKVFDQTTSTEVFKERYSLSILTDMANSLIAAVGGVTTTVQTSQGPVQQRQGGAISILAGLTGTLYTTPPASSVEYLADLGSNLGIVKPAYAQGLGFSAFSPVLGLWKIFRDIAYLGFVIIFVIVGFMIMFRKKIDPRTVVTIQEALPRVVITLLLVTFSYAIAGLIIDISQLSTRLVVNLFAGKFIALETTGVQGLSTAEKVNRLLSADIFSLVNPLRTVTDLIGAFPQIALTSLEVGALAFLAGLTIGVVFAILSFFIMFKIFFALLGPYISIVLSVVFAPIMLLGEAIPGSQNSFTNWLKGFIANIAVFPVTFAMLIMAAIFHSGSRLCSPYGGGIGTIAQRQQTPFLAPADWATQCQPFGINLLVMPGIGNWGPLVGQLISFGILFAIPKVADIVKESLQVKPGIAQQIAGQEVQGGLARVPLIGSFLPK